MAQQPEEDLGRPVQPFALTKDEDVINLHMDSQVSVAFVNRIGGTRSRILCAAALDLWKMVLSKMGWVKAH